MNNKNHILFLPLSLLNLIMSCQFGFTCHWSLCAWLSGKSVWCLHTGSCLVPIKDLLIWKNTFIFIKNTFPYTMWGTSGLCSWPLVLAPPPPAIFKFCQIIMDFKGKKATLKTELSYFVVYVIYVYTWGFEFCPADLLAAATYLQRQHICQGCFVCFGVFCCCLLVSEKIM